MNTLGLIIIGLVLTTVGTGCGSECGDLQDVCDSCTGTLKTQCEAVANADDAMACEAEVQSFEADCPAATED